MEEAKKYLLDIGFDDAHLPELVNDDDKSIYTIPELMQAYTDHKLKLLGIADVIERFFVVYDYLSKKFQFMETAWTEEEVNKTEKWIVESEHNDKEEAQKECDRLNAL